MSPAARAGILDPKNEVYLSAVSVWEIARKYAQGGLSLPSHPSALIPAVRKESGIASLSLTETIVTSDPAFDPYPVRVVW